MASIDNRMTHTQEIAPPTIDERVGDACPVCGHPERFTMQALRLLVSGPPSEFSSDLAEWLSPPQRPKRPVSTRHRSGTRNSIAFAGVGLIAFATACYALSGALPSVPLFCIAMVVAALFGYKNWRTERKLADKEDALLMGAHRERFRAYLYKKRVWSRLRYCSKCGKVMDPKNLHTRSLFEVHELVYHRPGTED